MSNRNKIKEAMHRILSQENIDDGFIKNYFSADKYFKSVYETGVLKGEYFVESTTCTHSNGSESTIIKLNKITTSGVKKIREFPTVKVAKDFLNAYVNIYNSIIEHSDKTGEELKESVIKGREAFKLTGDYECLALAEASQAVIELLK